MEKKDNRPKFVMPDLNPPRFIAGIDPYDESTPLPIILGRPSVGKTSRAMEAMVDPDLLYEFANFEEGTFKEDIQSMIKYYNSQAPIINSATKHYKIVLDEQKLQEFIDFLPDLEGNDKFYYCLFARKKYNATEGLKSDKNQLKRGTTTKERMIRDFKKLEVAYGLYEIDGIPIEQESLVLYVSPNPTDTRTAAAKTALDITKSIVENRVLPNPSALALNYMQTCVRKKYFNIDVDFTQLGLETDRKEVKNLILEKNYVNESALTFVNTRGGFHILVEYDKIHKLFERTWYRNFNLMVSSLFDVDMNNGSGFTPTAGCVQSNYIPSLI